MTRPARLALLALGAASAALPSAADGGPRHARLAIAGERPLAVSGVGFAPSEIVSVVVYLDAARSKRIVATRAGSLRVRFTFSIPRCTRYTVRAFGSRGSRAFFSSRIALDCQPDR
jgi:hypothetical protein